MVTILEILTILFLVWLALNTLAKADILFTLVESDDGKIVQRNGRAIKLLHAIEGMRRNPDNPFHVIPGKENLGIFTKLFNWQWIGNPLTDRVQEVAIQKSWPNPDGTGPDDWVIVAKEKTIVRAIHHTIPRTFTLRDVDFAGAVPGSLKITVMLKVFEFYTPTNKLDGDFFDKVEQSLRAGVGNLVREMTPRDYMSKRRDTEGILKELKDQDGIFNVSLFGQTGIKLWEGAIEDQQFPQEVQDALNAEILGREKGLGELAEAEGHAKAIRAVREVEVQMEGAELDQMVAALVAKGVKPDIAAIEASRILTARAQPDVTVKVEGGGNTPSIVLPTEGKRKK